MNCLTQRCAHEGHLFFLLLGLCHSSALDKSCQLLKQRVIKVVTFDHHAVVEIKEPLCIGSWLCSTVLLLASLLASWASSFEVGGLGDCCRAKQGSLETCVQEGSVCKCLGACNRLTYEPSSTTSFASLSSDTGSATLASTPWHDIC